MTKSDFLTAFSGIYDAVKGVLHGRDGARPVSTTTTLSPSLMERAGVRLALLLCAFLCAASVNAQTWQIGSPNAADVTATLSGTGNNRTLTISGTGAMRNFGFSSQGGPQLTHAPWRNYYYSIETVIIDNGVTNIGDDAFVGCSGLTSITIGEGVTSIGTYAFFECTGLTSVTIPNSVTSIDYLAFYRCTGLTSVTIGEGVTTIGNTAFLGCSRLTSIDVASNNANFSSYEGVLFNKAQTALIVYPGSKLGAYIIPNSVTSIGSYAFSGCTGLTSVTIPNSVTSIGSFAFSGCTGLKSVTIGESVSSIGDYAFSGCTGLTTFSNRRSTPQSINNANVFENYGVVYGQVPLGNVDLYVPQSSIPLYQTAAVWQNFKQILTGFFTITFVPRNGNDAFTVNAAYLETIEAPEAPEHPDALFFGGWHTDDVTWNNTTLWDFEVDRVRNNMTLYARWGTADEVRTVTFNSVGGTPAVELENVLVNARVAPITPTRAGYHFEGWFLNDVKYNFRTPVTENITLIARWSVVNTLPASSVTVNTAALGGDVHGAVSIARGVALSIETALPSLETENTIIIDVPSPAAGIFTVNATGLSANTSYFFRAYAIVEDSDGKETVHYGQTRLFTTRSTSNWYRMERVAFEQRLPSTVEMTVRVLDQSGRGVNSLENHDFQIWENDVFTASVETYGYTWRLEHLVEDIGDIDVDIDVDAIDANVKMVLALDITSSLGRLNIEKVVAAAIDLVEKKDPNHQYAIIIFRDDVPELIQGLTKDADVLIAALESIDSYDLLNTTNLYDAYMMGMNLLSDNVATIDLIEQNFMILFTDGQDESSFATLAQCVAARNNREVYVIGVGDVDANVLRQLASRNENYILIDNVDELEIAFAQAQEDIREGLRIMLDELREALLQDLRDRMRSANSLYRLNYLSPKRGDTHDLKLRIAGNTNTAANSYGQATFDASDFVSVHHGLFVNPYATFGGRTTGAYGLTEGVAYAIADGDELELVSYWSATVPRYVWTSSGQGVVTLESTDFGKYEIKFTGTGGQEIITLTDVGNYNLVSNGLSPTIKNFQASAFQQSFLVSSSGSISVYAGEVHTVSFNSDGGMPVPNPQLYRATVSVAGLNIRALKAQPPAVAPEKAGYIFEGWYSGGEKWDFDTPVTGDVDLRASWKPLPQLQITTVAASEITQNSAVLGGIIAEEGDGYLELGICYGTALNPTPRGMKMVITDAQTDFSAQISGLTANAAYYFRAYATTAQDTVYGANAVFHTRSTSPFYRLTGHPPAVTYRPSFVDALVSIRDNAGKGVDYLDNDEFNLFENSESVLNRPETHYYIRKMDAIPFAIKTVLMLDVSSSMTYDGIEEMKQAAVELVKIKYERQEYAVYAFSDAAVLIQDFTADADLLVQRISEIEMGASSTDLYDSYMEGMNKLPEEFSSRDGIQKCFFVMISDGDETRQRFTSALENSAVSARGSKTAYMIGLGHDLNTARLTQLASSAAHYHSATNIEGVKNVFLQIQNDIMREANSFYNLTYLSSKRGTAAVTLRLEVSGNTNTANDRYYQTSFVPDADFGPTWAGVYLNPFQNVPNIIEPTSRLGIGLAANATSTQRREITPGVFTLPDGFALQAVTYWANQTPRYEWTSSNPEIVTVEGVDWDKGVLKFHSEEEQEAIITVIDVANYDFIASLDDEFKGLDATFADFFIRMIRVRGMKAPPVPPSITTTTLSGGTVDVSYSQALAADGDQPVTWTITVGNLPEGLTFFSNGAISGTPTQAGTFTFTVRADNDAGHDTKEFTIVIAKSAGAAVSAPTLAGLGATSVTINAVAAPATGQEIEYARNTVNTVPTGGWQTALTFTGLTANTTYYIFARAGENDNYHTGAASAPLTVTTASTVSAPVITTTALASGATGAPYNAALVASGDAPVWSHTAGNLPNGLTLSAGGVISGTPAAPGTFTFTVRAVNDAGNDSKELSITIVKGEGATIASAPTFAGAGAMSITIYAVAAPANGQQVEYAISGTNIAPMSFGGGMIRHSENDWQTGLTFTGLTANTTYYIFARAKENDVYHAGAASPPLTVTTNATFTAPSIVAATLSDGTAGVSYSVVIVASGDAPFTWSITEGALPAGLTLNASTGEISGTPSAVGDFTFTVNASNEAGNDSRSFTLTIAEAPITPAVVSVAVSPKTATVEKGKTQQFSVIVNVEGGAAPTVAWSVNSSISSISAEGLLSVAAGETATTLTVRATSTEDNTKFDTATVNVSSGSTTNVEALSFADLKIYPNPFAGVVRITGAGTVETRHAPSLQIQIQMQVVNAAGAVIHAQMITNPDETINLEHLPSGVYVFRFEKDGNVRTERVVKE